MKRELDTLSVPYLPIGSSLLWREIMEKTWDNALEVVLPVEYLDHDTNLPIGGFSVSFVEDKNGKYIQLDNFHPAEFGDKYINNQNNNWEVIPGGVYRIKI